MIMTAAAILLPVGNCACTESDVPSPERWEATIAAFEAHDRKEPQPTQALLFTGSSTVVRWGTLSADFPFAPVINRGFGGSQVSDVLAYVDRVIIAHAPRVVVLYSGDNDVAAGKSPEQILADYAALQARIHDAMPEARLVIVGPKPSPNRWNVSDAFKAINAGLADWAATLDGVDAWDISEWMLGADGLPRPELYCDGVHLTPEGYALWTAYLQPRLRAIWAASAEAGPC